MFRKTLRAIGWYLAGSLLMGGCLLLEVLPWYPKTAIGWVAFFACALPIAAVGEFAGPVVFENRFVKRLEPSNDPGKVSGRRIVYGVVAMLGLVALGVTICKLWPS